MDDSFTEKKDDDWRLRRVLPSNRLSLKDRLSRLTFKDACKLLGSQGQQLIQRQREHVCLDDRIFRMTCISAAICCACGFPRRSRALRPVIVTITLMAEARERLHYRCDHCGTACDHVGAVFSMVLEEKSSLGLAEPPPERKPVASLDEDDLVNQALADRQQRAREEKMTVKSADAKKPWTVYTVTNRLSGKTYRITFRGFEPGESSCTCPDFRTNTLGTCKHILKVARVVRRNFTAAHLQRKFRPSAGKSPVHLHYSK